jgi:hypothetical protein
MRPDIDYKHVLNELSVNRQDPCEVIRELISNAYDAGAKKIVIAPLPNVEGFLFYDDGQGVSDVEEKNGITPWRAFFSIGRSTKVMGESIGYKCQGSKLCFAAARMSLITRCRHDEKGHYRYITIDNPKNSLSTEYEIDPTRTADPWAVVQGSLHVLDAAAKTAVEFLRGECFEMPDLTGTLIVVQKFDVESFSKYFAPNGHWYLREYIRFSTRYGDMRILRSDETGFSKEHEKNFKATRGYRDDVRLLLWSRSSSEPEHVQAGYPYMPKSTDPDVKSPAEIAKLTDGRFSSRHATTFKYNDETYCVTLAVDGNRRAHELWEMLDRRGSSNAARSGLGLKDQRGTHICSHGVKICAYHELFSHPNLRDFSELEGDAARVHFTMLINGNFELVTNRNSLTERSYATLRSEGFVEHIEKFLRRAQDRDPVFRELGARLRRESEQYRTERYLKQHSELKSTITTRERIRLGVDCPLKGEILLSPLPGEEHWVAVLYTMLAYMVPKGAAHEDLWLKPRTYTSVGIDSLAVERGKHLLTDPHWGVEYKWSFSPKGHDVYNHMLTVTRQIVAWDLDDPKDGTEVQDEYNYFGRVRHVPELSGIGYQIERIESRSGDVNDEVVNVVCLRELIRRTFLAEFSSPPPASSDSKHAAVRTPARKRATR